MLRQRTWAIMIRPYHIRSIGGGVRIDYKGVPKAGNSSDLGYQGTNSATALDGNGRGGFGGGAMPITGGWTVWYIDTSFKNIKEKYKKLLQETSRDNALIVEILPTDTLITPLS